MPNLKISKSKLLGEKQKKIGARFILKYAGLGFAVVGAFLEKGLLIFGILLFFGSFLIPKVYKKRFT